jgi:GATA-binding protein
VFSYNTAIPTRLGISSSSPLSKEEKSISIRIPNNSNHDTGLYRYSPDRSRFSGMPHRNNQTGISFSPSNSSLVRHEPFSAIYNNALIPSSSHSSTDYYLPPGSTSSSTLSTPQPILENEQMFFNSNIDI